MSTSNHRAKFALNCEVRVLREFSARDYHLLYHRKKIFDVEVDFMFIHPQRGLVLCEVKSNRAGWSLHDRITRRQIERLYSVYLKLSAVVQEPVQFRVVMVSDILNEYNLKDFI